LDGHIQDLPKNYKVPYKVFFTFAQKTGLAKEKQDDRSLRYKPLI
jgi:hypothetical protein